MKNLKFIILSNLSFIMIPLQNSYMYAQSVCIVNGQQVPCEQYKGIFALLAALGIGFVIFVAILGILCTIFWIWMLVHAITHEIKDKTVWVIVLIFTGILGAVIYYFVVKRHFNGPTTVHSAPVPPTSPSQDHSIPPSKSSHIA